MIAADSLSPLLAGPILRRVRCDEICFWLALTTSGPVRISLSTADDKRCITLSEGDAGYQVLRASRRLCYLLLRVELNPPLASGTWVDYHLDMQGLEEDAAQPCWRRLTDDPALHYAGRQSPVFRVPGRVEALLHGSCRRPHHPGGDGLVEADRLLARCIRGATSDNAGADAATGATERYPLPAWPALLLMSGDQIYADDAGGPTLRAIHQLLSRLAVPNEVMAGLKMPGVDSSEALYRHSHSYYRREMLLPSTETTRSLLDLLFGGAQKPVFTSASAHNHLISLGEYLAVYLLVWSPLPWQGLDLSPPPGLDMNERALYEIEQVQIAAFVAGLSAVRRVMAHLPVAMVFDDHDISDDWNLNRAWEEAAYSHPFSRRMIGNGLISYLINQGWGNRPEAFSDSLLAAVQAALEEPGGEAHKELVETLLQFEGWDYDWATEPPLVVLDTRTRRWRSESSAHKPSGLIDWEALTDLQRRLQGQDSVLLVSAAPIFGVKLIEVIQRIFTFFGKPLLVDAENWMAHPGTAYGILNVFRHSKTPQHFVVLSGDVHYSFVYDVELRGQQRGPDIWQICSSGLRNTFPDRLLTTLDHLNRWFYHPRSPLNWFTKRRLMCITPRKPLGTPHGRRLLNATGIGLVELDDQGRPWRIRQLVDGGRAVEFERRDEETNWR